MEYDEYGALALCGVSAKVPRKDGPIDTISYGGVCSDAMGKTSRYLTPE
jgi:hypothetical protein